ncbi:hypothetical protein HHK36_003862 [Tetracentron sinense]|uniref:Retrovirus-related Pol polyprotein from transposon TNT 1-94-like beta-barrel domain-containing protein n=1 Tax=Tetracentron sinense TaxID=13715 RepID=A0A834ZT87_TETSI|nr:hypothetical protein HHK36_003862 [Tetracentron sinense]
MTVSNNQDSEWFPVTGSNAHMTRDDGKLHNLVPYTGSDSVMAGNGQKLYISHISETEICNNSANIPLHEVLLVLDMKKNLLSVSQLASNYSCYFELIDSGFMIKDRKTNKVLASGSKKGGLYALDESRKEALFSTREKANYPHTRTGMEPSNDDLQISQVPLESSNRAQLFTPTQTYDVQPTSPSERHNMVLPELNLESPISISTEECPPNFLANHIESNPDLTTHDQPYNHVLNESANQHISPQPTEFIDQQYKADAGNKHAMTTRAKSGIVKSNPNGGSLYPVLLQVSLFRYLLGLVTYIVLVAFSLAFRLQHALLTGIASDIAFILAAWCLIMSQLMSSEVERRVIKEGHKSFPSGHTSLPLFFFVSIYILRSWFSSVIYTCREKLEYLMQKERQDVVTYTIAVQLSPALVSYVLVGIASLLVGVASLIVVVVVIA